MPPFYSQNKPYYYHRKDWVSSHSVLLYLQRSLEKPNQTFLIKEARVFVPKEDKEEEDDYEVKGGEGGSG